MFYLKEELNTQQWLAVVCDDVLAIKVGPVGIKNCLQ